MKKIVIRRLVAYMIDYIIIAIYAILLFGIATIFNFKKIPLTPISAQLVGFISLTLPVFFYFFLSEQSKTRATVGKRILNISVRSDSQNSKPHVLTRNILKLLPWEIAHTGVHWIVFYSKSDQNPPVWVWITLILPQVIIVIYLISIVISGGKSSLYDKVSNTKIEMNQPIE
ncbi:RDD family protein [Aquimarina spongiae]|uniref:RDD family protein n=1 Tax=Aquimarina spongiae TaxID=570521 RepID=A0A1M6DUT7_9FLAO|nr:RDD family protein [Aquimarina spongiae]SHI77004.1 RDD family protein [Aquimarina spongiae]